MEAEHIDPKAIAEIVRHWHFPPTVADMVRVENYVRDTAPIVAAALAQTKASDECRLAATTDTLNSELAARLRTEQAVRAARGKA